MFKEKKTTVRRDKPTYGREFGIIRPFAMNSNGKINGQHVRTDV